MSEKHFNTSNNKLKLIDGVLYNSDGSELILYPAGKEGAEFRIPDSVKTIKEGAFTTNYNIEKVINHPENQQDWLPALKIA